VIARGCKMKTGRDGRSSGLYGARPKQCGAAGRVWGLRRRCMRRSEGPRLAALCRNRVPRIPQLTAHAQPPPQRGTALSRAHAHPPAADQSPVNQGSLTVPTPTL
jgi:hypothetical protein